jgi:hypothetical protein
MIIYELLDFELLMNLILFLDRKIDKCDSDIS